MQIVIKARDEASRVLKGVEKNVKGFNQKVKNLQPTFRKMALIGTAAFAGVAAAAGNAVKQAAAAEGSYNKFNTVFAEGAAGMLDFVKDIRKEMPTATSKIVRMAADLQDLLVPMGIARDKGAEMTKGFLDLANKVAAFNDVDPTEVLEAIKSGLAGSSEPLRRFGINALESALEARALKEGLLEAGQTFKDLDPEVKAAVRAQALLAQAIDNSADAIGGFEVNNDSFMRRQQNLTATIEEFSETIGFALLPIMDDALRKILPVAQKLKEWAEDNPKLVRTIIFVSAALLGLIATIGLVGIALSVLSAPFAGPIALMIVGIMAIITAGVLLKKHWETIKNSKVWNTIKDGVSVATDFIREKIGLLDEKTAGLQQNWKLFQDGASEGWKILGENISAAVGFINQEWEKLILDDTFISKVSDSVFKLSQAMKRGLDSIQSSVSKAIEASRGFFDRLKGDGESDGFFGWLADTLFTSPLGDILPKEHGGIVPGPAGRSIPIMAHGQERIIPAGQEGDGGGKAPIIMNFNFNDVVAGDDGIRRIIEQTISKLDRESTLSVVAGA